MTLEEFRAIYAEALRLLSTDKSFTAACAAQQAAIDLQNAEANAQGKEVGQ